MSNLNKLDMLVDRFDERKGVFDLRTIRDRHYGRLWDDKELAKCFALVADLAPKDFKTTWERLSYLCKPEALIYQVCFYYNLLTSVKTSSNHLPHTPNTGVIFGSALAISWVFENEEKDWRPLDEGSWLREYYDRLDRAKTLENVDPVKIDNAIDVPWFKELYCEDFGFVRGMLDELAVMYPGSALYNVLGEAVMANPNKAPSIDAWYDYLSTPDRLPLEWWYPLTSEKQDFSPFLR